MRRKIVVAMLAVMISGTMVFAEPAAAQGGGCKAFGQNIAFLAQLLGPGFGQATSETAPLNALVEAEQNALCG